MSSLQNSRRQSQKKKSEQFLQVSQVQQQFQQQQKQDNQKLKDFVEDEFQSENTLNHSFNSKQNMSSSNLNAGPSRIFGAPRKTAYVGGGFGVNFDDIIGFDDNAKEAVEEQEQFKNLQYYRGSVFRNQRLTLTNPKHMEMFNLEQDSSFQNLDVEMHSKIPRWFSWIILFYFAIIGASIPPWVLSIPAEKYLRISWRFYMQAMLLIPFIMYEKRQQKNKKFYQLSYIFSIENLKNIYLTSFSNSLWFTMVLFGFEWTFIGHSLILGSLQLFFMSIKRSKEDSHWYEHPGRIMTIIGIILIFTDAISFDPADANPSAYTYKVIKYLHRNTYQRVIFGNCAALCCSFFMTKFVDNNKQTNQKFPPHLRMFIISLFNSVNMMLSAYFFSGSDIFYVRDQEGRVDWSWFSLFSSAQFSGFLFMSLMLGLGSFISSIFLAKLFEPLDIQTAQSFEPIIACLIINIVNVQHLPNGLACIGFTFIIPGLFFINLGQHLKIQDENKKKEQEIVQKQSVYLHPRISTMLKK